MNDASFCTDAHRQAYAEEQQLAMQRLAASAPSLGRTQKMAAMTGEEPVMQEAALPFPLGPFPIAGGTACIQAVDPKPAVPSIFLAEREQKRQGGQPALLAGPVPLSVATQGGRRTMALAYPEPVSQLRVAVPRPTGTRLGRTGGWNRVRLLPLPPSAECGQRAKAVAGEWSSCGARLTAPPRFVRTGQRRLPRALRLAPLPAAAPASTAATYREPAIPLTAWTRSWHLRDTRRQMFRTELLPIDSLAPVAISPCERRPAALPVAASCFPPHVQPPRSGLKAIADTAPPVDETTDEWQALWPWLEKSPLGALLVATASYERSSPRPAGRRAKPLAFPNPVITRTTVATPIGERRISSTSAVLAVAAPEPHSVPGQHASAAGMFLSPRLDWYPARSGRSKPSRLHAEQGIVALLPLLPAAGPSPAYWDATWSVQSPDGTVISRTTARYRAVGQLQSRRMASLPTVAAAGNAPHPLVAAEWSVPAPGSALPRARMAGRTLQPGKAYRVAWALDIGKRPAGIRPSVAGNVSPVVRMRFPQHESVLSPRYNPAGSVPVPAPGTCRPLWTPSSRATLPPGMAAVLPEPRGIRRASGLRRIALRLHRVPNAQPMARPASGGTMVLGLDGWGGKPAMLPSCLRADDGRTPRKDPAAGGLRGKFGEWQEKLAPRRWHAVWNKTAHLPSDLKWIAMVVPLVIGIWVLARPSTAEPAPAPASSRTAETIPQDAAPAQSTESAAMVPPEPIRVPVATPKPAPPPAPVKAVAKPAPATDGAWETLTARIANRASVNLVEDFRNGLSAWEGKGDWARSWSYDKSGTVRPGQMAIFQPSVGLKDYVFEMKASIDRHAIQWMVRASNPQNYHLSRLNITPGAPLTKLELERWTVVNGKPGRVARMPLPHGGANQTLYSIRVEARGDSITTYLQDQVIDTFNDPRLIDGGIGLIGSGEDRPRIYGIHVFHQNDFLGKLCSFLAPPPINTQGSD